MKDTEPEIKTVYEVIQGEFDHLDKQVGDFGKRHIAITELSQLERDLYLVHDIVAMTCNSGTGPWIRHHYEEPGWISCSEMAFTNIGYPQVSDGIRSCLAVCLSKGDAMTYKDDEIPSNYIIEHADEIMRSLYVYLLKHNYAFHNPEA